MPNPTFELPAKGRAKNSLSSEPQMSFTAFLTLCVLGCDFLIYFLYEWAFGERRRERMRKGAFRQRTEALADREPRPATKPQQNPEARGVLVMHAKGPRAASPRIPNPCSEALAYRRVVASFVQLKPRT